MKILGSATSFRLTRDETELNTRSGGDVPVSVFHKLVPTGSALLCLPRQMEAYF
mgnify:CR=1 FL=1